VRQLPRYLTLGQAAHVLGVTRETLARWARESHVPALKTPGGRWRFVAEDLILVLRRAGHGSSDAEEGQQ
jgi:excisionase family DNA binding protein